MTIHHVYTQGAISVRETQEKPKEKPQAAQGQNIRRTIICTERLLSEWKCKNCGAIIPVSSQVCSCGTKKRPTPPTGTKQDAQAALMKDVQIDKTYTCEVYE